MQVSLVCLSLKIDFECSRKAGVHTNDVLVRQWLQLFWVLADKENLSDIMFKEIEFSVV